MRKITCLLVGVMILLAGRAWAGEEIPEIEVVAEGYSYLGDDASIKEARAKAMAEAERAALEQGVPIYLDSYTKVRNYQVDKDEIKSRMRGIIKNKQVLVDELDKEELKYKIKIKAVVTYTQAQQESLEKEQIKNDEQEEGNVLEIHMKGNRRVGENVRVYRVEPVFRPQLEPPRECYFPPERLEFFWDSAQRLQAQRPRQYVHLVALLYPNVRRERIVDYLFVIRRHNPLKFRRIVRLLFPALRRVPELERGLLAEKIHRRLRRLLKNNPHRFVELLRLALPHLNPREFRRRLERICRNRPRIMREVEEILSG